MLNYSEYFEKRPSASTRTLELGKLHLPSGRIACCDPFLSQETGALETAVPPGDYGVDLCLATLPKWGQRVALARLLFSASTVVQWRKAMHRVDLVSRSDFPVEAGLACFMDQSTRELLVRVVSDWHAKGVDANYYDDVLAREFKQNADPSNPYDVGHWALHSPAKGDDRNVAMFASGLGDGIYHAYWGIDAAGKPAMLVADFDLLPMESA